MAGLSPNFSYIQIFERWSGHKIMKQNVAVGLLFSVFSVYFVSLMVKADRLTVINNINPHTNMRGPRGPRKILKAAQTIIIAISELMF